MVLCNDLEGPVDIAMWEHARQVLNGDPQQLVDQSKRLEEELFTSETKYMITAITGNMFKGQGYNFLKGAPEIVMGMCKISAEEKTRFLALVDQWAGEGLRMIGLAYRPLGKLDDYSGYTWVGLVGMEDPVREGVVEAVQVAQKAGIQVKMITGDYRKTAEHIARSIGLMKEGDLSMEGPEVAALSDEDLQEKVKHTSVFARIRPQDKFRIVKALQANGEITAMIGDGVNDAPALQRANIGVVVGSATDVAKETADLILLDNNFRTIVAAIEEGRIIFQNIRKVVAYTLSNSFAEVLTIFVAMLLGWPAPLMVAQILWIHLICDGPSDIVLGFEPKEPGIMDEKPKSLKEPILNHLGLSLIGVISVSSAVAVLFLFHHLYSASRQRRRRAQHRLRLLCGQLDGLHLRLPQHAPAALPHEQAQRQQAAGLGGAGRAGHGSPALPRPGLAQSARHRPADHLGMAGSGRDRPWAADGGRGGQVDQQQDPCQ